MTTATKTHPQASKLQANNVVSFPAKKRHALRRKATSPTAQSQHLSRKVQSPKKSPEAAFRLIETTDASLETLMAAKSVASGLRNNETVLLVSPENPEHLIRKLAMTGLNVEPFVERGKLIIFSSQPAIAGNLSLATNYREVFGELFDLAGCPVDRIVILKMDLLVNLESQYLAYASVSKFTQAADEMGCKFIAQYSRNQSEAHDRLDAACSSLVNSYFIMKRGEQRKKYQLKPKNIAA